MKVLLDTNIILDVWLAREPYWRDAAELLGKVENKEITGVICPTTITTLHYLGKKVIGEKKTRLQIRNLLEICKIGQLSKESFTISLGSEINDFEDAVIESVAIKEKVDYIITRNLKDFRKAKIEAKEAIEVL